MTRRALEERAELGVEPAGVERVEEDARVALIAEHIRHAASHLDGEERVLPRQRLGPQRETATISRREVDSIGRRTVRMLDHARRGE
jgi:hypothetical protein